MNDELMFKSRIVKEAMPIEMQKRFKVPIEIEAKCPKCGTWVKHNLYDAGCYLMSPLIGVPYEEGFYCERCDNDFFVMINVSINIELSKND